jgi:hypothetical protein
MKKIDLLSLVSTAVFSPEDAEDAYDYYMDNYTASDNVVQLLGFSRKEWTAHAHGAPFAVIANWRTLGWPDECFLCGEEIVSDNYGWFPRKRDGIYGLVHITCLPDL